MSIEDQNMEYDSDFVHLGKTKEMTEEFLTNEIQKLKEQQSALIDDEAKLKKATEESESLAEQLQDRGEKMEKRILDQEQELRQTKKLNEEHLECVRQDNKCLGNEIQKMRDTLNEIKKNTAKLYAVSASGKERKMVFKGNVFKNMSKIQMRVNHQILHSVVGGTALITFEKPEVASNVIGKTHIIPVEDYRIKVMAEGVELLVLHSLGLDMSLSFQKVLVSNLPSFPEDLLMDKLELFFSKTKNGGGEVEKREFIADCRSVILTFVSHEVAQNLTEKKNFEIPFGESTHKVHVTSSLNGNIKEFEMRKLVCNRTVLITGIPDIMEEETLRDMLEIYFQKGSNGGGEVIDLLYCPEGHHKFAIFEEDDDDDDDEAV
ncbi:interferon-induced 35 kDa protein isoform X2 [Pelobates fuscus]